MQFPQISSPGDENSLSVVAQICFYKRALRAALEIAMIIAKIFEHLNSLDEIILITFLTASALSLYPCIMLFFAIRPHSVFFQPGQK